ncbi:MAG: ABC transporter permease, partial [Acidobacteriota bacterium]
MDWHPSAVSLYRVLLLAYPAEFRREYGAELESIFAERLTQEPSWRLWLEAIRDAAVAAPREHIAILNSDVRHAVRLFANAPGFTSVALLVIALGIGSTATVFSLVNAVLLRSLPYGDADRLVYMWRPFTNVKELPLELSPSAADAIAWRERGSSFIEVTAFEQQMLLLTGGPPVRVSACRVFGNFFQTLDVHPQRGRLIEESDDRPGSGYVAVISDALWHARFGGDANVVGQTIEVNKKLYEVIGVMPKGFAYPHANDFPGDLYSTRGPTELWIPMALTPQQRADAEGDADTSAAIGRLRPGVSMQQAQAEMSAIQKELAARYKEPELKDGGLGVLLKPFVETAVGPVRPLLQLLSGAVLLVLLISTSNVANLLLARAAGRVHEMGVRTALGAERARLLRQMLTEALLFAMAGGALGIAVSFVAVRLIAQLNPGDIPRFEETALDLRVLGFAVGVSVVTGLLLGILPARAALRPDVLNLLRQGGRGVAGGASRTRSALIVIEVALSVVLLASAALFLRSYRSVQQEDKGFAPSTLTMNVAMDPEQTPEQKSAKVRELMEAARRMPGVDAVGSVEGLPLSHFESIWRVEIEGNP